MTGTRVSGLSLFARYAYPPNELGYCGPGNPAAVLDQARSEISGNGAQWVRQFDGAWPYLEAIANGSGIEDPLDSRVVQAYWVGGELLGGVESSVLVDGLHLAFGERNSTGILSELEPQDNALAHHSFHVFVVYPWVKLLRSHGSVPLSVLQNCRIRFGMVQKVHDELADVLTRPLQFDGHQILRGEPVLERVRWNDRGFALGPVPVPGTLVTMHWDWLCDSISPDQGLLLEGVEDSALEIVNTRLRDHRL